MSDAIDTLFVVIYNLTIIIGTAYLVQVYDWSGWWFLLAVIMLGTNGKNKKCECKYKEPPKKEEKKIITNGRHFL